MTKEHQVIVNHFKASIDELHEDCKEIIAAEGINRQTKDDAIAVKTYLEFKFPEYFKEKK